MSTAKRAFDLLRGYVNHGLDWVQGREEFDADQELAAAMQTPPRASAVMNEPPPPPMDLATARKLLTVPEKPSSSQIEAAYQEIASVIDPAKFAAGSPAHARARDLLKRLDEARRVLLANVDPTVRRFERLEID